MTAEIRRVGPGDEETVRVLTDSARYQPLSSEAAHRFLAESGTIMLVAFDDGEPVGSVLGYELQRRHGPERSLFVYDIDVDEAHRGRGVATELMRSLLAIAREDGGAEAFVNTDESNETALRFYESLGGFRERDDYEVFDFQL